VLANGTSMFGCTNVPHAVLFYKDGVCAPAATHRDSCELVHIDFSVCFDKGASLAVPEVVPFRLTQMMQVRGPSTGRLGAFAHLWRHH
jgi:hypothetical protein